MRPPRPFARLVDFSTEQDGVAAVEFALILPFLLFLFLGSIEASSLITVDRRVTVISGTVGDLVARTDGNLSNTTMTDYFLASQNIIFPYGTTGLEQVVSLISVDASGNTSVVWSCAHNGGTKRTATSSYDLPVKMNELARGGWVVASETAYAYRPVLGIVFTDAINLHRESFYLPRYEEAIGAPAC